MKKLFLLMGLLSAAAAAPSDAQASACGDDYHLVPANAVITMEPQRDCVVVDVTGSSQPGCEQIEVTITNECEDVLQVPEPTRDLGCVEDYPAEQPVPGEACPVLYVGYTLAINELADSPGRHKLDVRLLEQAGPIDIHVEFDVVESDDGSGCSASQRPGHLSATDSIAALLGVAALRGRLRKRARRSL
jgi:hypothetical protein